MLRMLGSKKLFFKYLLSYVLVFTLPVLLLGLVIYNSIIDVFSSEINDRNAYLVEQAQHSIDTRIEELRKLSIQISDNPYLSRTRLQQDFNNIIMAIDMLKHFSLPNNFYSDFFIYYPDIDLICSPSGTYNSSHFFNLIYKFENWSLDQLNKDILHAPAYFVRASEKVNMQFNNTTGQFITYIVPIPYGSDTPSGAVIFLIHEKMIESLLSDSIKANNGKVFILDEHRNLLTSFGEPDIVLESIPDWMESNAKTSIQKIFQGEKNYYVSSTKSSRTYWTYITVVPTYKVLSKVISLRTKVFMTFIVVFLLGSCLIYYLMLSNYRPVGELISYSNKVFNTALPRSNGIETVRSAVGQMSATITSLEQKVKDNIPHMKRVILMDLLQGCYADVSELNLKGNEYGIAFSDNNFCIALFLLEPQDVPNKKAVLSEIATNLPYDMEGYTLESTDDNTVITFLSTKEKSNDLVIGFLTDLHRLLSDRYDIKTTIGLGNMHSGLEEIPKSYLEASSALDYRFIKGKSTVIAYGETEQSQKNANFYPSQLMEQIQMSLLKGDYVRVSEQISEITTKLKESYTPIIIARFACYNIINTVMTSVYRLNLNINIKKDGLPDIISLSKIETLEELSEQVQGICQAIFSKVTCCRSDGRTHLDEILAYIKEKYSDNNFSLQSMTDDLYLSTSYISHYFKAQTGENISEYVNKLRMEKAKCLLSETNLSLQHIAFQIGYTNVSSFIRKFKQTTGITPGSYRDLPVPGSKQL